MAGRSVVVVGGGTGGLVAVRRLRRLLDRTDRVVLVTRDARHCFAPSFLWVMTGERKPERICLDLRKLRARGIEVVEAEAQGLDLEARTVTTSAGELAYDRLVLAPGVDLAPEAVPGFAEAAHTPYTLDGASSAAAALASFPGGRVAVLVSRVPYKCPAAPHEIAFLAESLLRRRGLRDGSSVDLYTPEPQPMPTAGPAMGEALEGLLGSRGIGFHPNVTVERIDPESRRLVLAEGGDVEYDLLLGVPAHRAPALARESGLAGETGFIPVDRATLATAAEGVYAIGDATTIPIAGGKFLPKAGVFAHHQAEVVAKRIAAELAGRTPSATFTGQGGCFLELGDRSAAYASGDFYAEEAPRIRLRTPGRRWHLGKVLFEQYWLRRWV